MDPSGSDDETFKQIIKTLDSKLDALLHAIKTNSLKGFVC